MGDTISRQAAIEATENADVAVLYHKDEPVDEAIEEAIFATKRSIITSIRDLPSAQPERKKGRWIRNDNGTYSCSVCQSWIPEEQHYYAQYCLYCGADMRGEQNE